VSSSNVSGIYKDGNDLMVRFNSGSIYRYHGAGDHYNPMLAAPSKGKYLNEQIKGKYLCDEE